MSGVERAFVLWACAATTVAAQQLARVSCDASYNAPCSRTNSEFLAREVASIRMQMGELATRDYLRSELRDELRSLLEEIEASPASH